MARAQAKLTFETTFRVKGSDEEAFRRAVESEGIRKGGYVESECAVEATVIRHGTKEEILGHTRRVFPRRGHT